MGREPNSMFRVWCPHCGTGLTARQEWVGREVACPKCATTFTLPPPRPQPESGPDAEQAPGPAVQTTKRPDEKFCVECGSLIKARAEICFNCGVRQMPHRVPGEGPSPGVAAVLSFVIPGMGQIYKGQILLGLLWFVGALLGYVACFVVCGIVIHIFSVIDAYASPPKTRGVTVS
jgi:TM2 domain-containing membrane protein YozV